jgi:NADPH:quinone reductase-like Zn-dependent oxidoreductase
MKAAIWTSYGPPEVLEVRDVEKPLPKDDEMLVRIAAANVFPGDCELRRFDIHNVLFWLPIRLFTGIRKPRIGVLGQELAGEVEAVGKAITRFKEGDQIFSPTAFGGAYAEYICLRERYATIKPAKTTLEEAATVSVGGLNALHLLREGDVRSGQKVLIYGAAGCIGTMAVQLAKVFGAEVTAVDSTVKLAALEAVGADHAIDYTHEDFTTNGETYDVIVDAVGKSPYSDSLRSLARGGYYVLGNPTLSTTIRAPWASMTTGRRVKIAMTRYQRANLNFLSELLTAGRIKPVIDRCYPLEEIVDAHRYVESGQKIGNVVITMTHERT